MGKEKAAAATVPTEAEELPKTIVRRVVKEKLSEISTDGGDVTLHKEALIAFSESARIFIHYLSATAHEICSDSKRQIINADDVLNALEEVEFSEFIQPLRASLDEFRKKAAGKRLGSAKAKEASKKRKKDEETAAEKGKGEETAIENGKGEETAVDNGEDEKGEDTAMENGKDEEEDNEVNEDEDEGEGEGEDEGEDEDEDEDEEASETKDDSHDN